MLSPSEAMDSEAVARAVAKSKAAKPLKDMLLDIIPENPLQEMAGAASWTCAAPC
jgi:hypothetical protein